MSVNFFNKKMFKRLHLLTILNEKTRFFFFFEKEDYYFIENRSARMSD